MKCNNCNCEVKEEEGFCHNCGQKIEREVIHEEKQERRIEDLLSHKKSGKKKAIIVISVILSIIAIAVAVKFFYDMKPKDIKMEANQLSKIIEDGDLKEYSGDNLFVHGYLLRRSDEDKTYILYTDDLTEFVVFTFEDGIDESLGDGSEVTIQGRIGELKKNSHIYVLIGEDLSVQKKLDRIYTINDLSDLCDNVNKYIGKKVEVWGKIIKTNSGSAYITNSDTLAKTAWLYGISSEELVEFKWGTWCAVTGVISVDGNKIIVEVDNVIQNDDTKMLDELESEDDTNDTFTVDDIVRDSEKYLNKVVTVEGLFPQSPSYDHSGNIAIKLLSDTSAHYIVLEGKKINDGGCKASVTGVLSYNGNDYVINVTDYEVIQRFVVGGN